MANPAKHLPNMLQPSPLGRGNAAAAEAYPIDPAQLAHEQLCALARHLGRLAAVRALQAGGTPGNHPAALNKPGRSSSAAGKRLKEAS